MAIYKYQALDHHGARHEGVLDAVDSGDAMRLLNLKGYSPLSITQQETSKSAGSSGRVSQKQIELLTAELSLLLKSGVRIDKALSIIKATKADPALYSLLTLILADLSAGVGLAAAFRRHQQLFGNLYCSLIEIGEASGNLATVFAALAENLSFNRELRAQVLGALVYPAVIFVVCLCAIAFIFNFVVPRMASVFDGAVGLPWYTAGMLSFSEWLQSYQLYLVLVIGLVGFAGYRFRGSTFVVSFLQSCKTRLPGFRYANSVAERIRFNSALATMLEAGLQIDRAMALAIDTLSTQRYQKELKIARDRVVKGEKLAAVLGQTELYPPFLISLVTVGEESNNLTPIFFDIARRSREEFSEWTRRMISLLEPIMILVLGGLVGGVVVIMLLSMVSLNDIGF